MIGDRVVVCEERKTGTIIGERRSPNNPEYMIEVELDNEEGRVFMCITGGVAEEGECETCSNRLKCLIQGGSNG